MGVAGPVDAYQRAAAGFGEILADLADEEWERPTRPDDWTVLTTTAWVVVGDAQVAAALGAGRLAPVGDFDAAVLGPNPVATWRGTALAAIRALQAPGALEQPVTHADGVIVVADIVGQRVSENLVRAWDLGVAIGRPAEPPDDLADWCLDFWAAHAEAVLAGGILPDEPRQPPADASAGERLLALTGR